MRLYMETTKVPAEQTAREIQELLVEAGARSVLTEYDAQQEISGLHFILDCDNQRIPFKMPVRTEKLSRYFETRARKNGYLNAQRSAAIKAKAKRVAWRQLLRWVEVQVAFIDVGMAKPAEVFMPYIQVAPNQTFFERLESQQFSGLLLTAGSETP